MRFNVSGEPVNQDSYLTDGQKLFRVVSQIAAGGGNFASLEDCRTLEVHAYSPGELAAMRLRPVTRGGAP